jgi:predicted DNA-binding protein with PD1-like motif
MFEIASMTGNVSMADDKPVAHIHIVLGKSDFSIFGGHLVSGIVGPTCEIILLPLETQIKREKDEKTGLMLTKF